MRFVYLGLLFSLYVWEITSQNEFRGRRRKVLKKRPVQRTPNALEVSNDLTVNAKTTDLSRETGQIINDVQCPIAEGLQVYPHPDSCNHFYKCTNGTLTLETCGNGLLFNEATSLAGAAENHCSYIWQTDCGERKSDTTPISSPGCEYQNGIFPSGDGCFASYTKCVNGKPSEVYCQLGLAYDHRIHACNWPDQLVESAGCDPSAAFGDFRCPTNEELSPLARRFFPYPRFPIPNEPKLYIICVDGMPRLNSCGEETIFDEETLGCAQEF
ncbi:protein obstructor-E isoform X2 [Eurytemora carolleeae]|uniref:protein obstructor-E isoform X2 n=1 Tax=Eurytemora carolleeae TaxID=1294199 RepID=UPI000C77E853|nr:protein obstructor-E isoform X2 [Eurytemora carolleeae]|eukprot:XP_023344298.1 protein obstructor-E-like isoform X2 [Eurytemora affinis]